MSAKSPDEKDAPLSDVRERVLDHMRSLVRSGATAGVATLAAVEAQVPSGPPHPPVCDPLPPPIECPAKIDAAWLGQMVRFDAAWQEDGKAALSMTLGWGRGGFTFVGRPQLSGAKVVDQSGNHAYAGWVLQPGDSRTAYIDAELACGQKAKVRYRVRLDGTRKAGERIEVTLEKLEARKAEPPRGP